MRIDVHSHLFSDAYVAGLRKLFAEDRSPTGQEVQRLIQWTSTDPRMTRVDLRLEEMSRYGIDMQILSIGAFHGALVSDPTAAAELAEMGNDTLIAAAHQHPDHFRALAAVPVQFPEAAIKEIERLAGQPEVVGVNVVGSAQAKPLNDPELEPFWAELERRQMPFLLHPVTARGWTACSS